ncbi:hypothetical protein [Photobacterium ganghwense]|uniref:hypothetical protein n=1 Tax=Photobacterium ganghwense TaxID=320778 RepID=UPI001A8CBEF0|nr:hypothetical protein [Photobacterium ganghwense]QSV17199.1 hypothetical protein FH974_19870 [Photobacterium ganghwense]
MKVAYLFALMGAMALTGCSSLNDQQRAEREAMFDLHEAEINVAERETDMVAAKEQLEKAEAHLQQMEVNFKEIVSAR